jgi:hypothetical protein
MVLAQAGQKGTGRVKTKKFSTITFNVAAFRHGSKDRLYVSSVRHAKLEWLTEQKAMNDRMKRELMRAIKASVDRLYRDLSS